MNVVGEYIFPNADFAKSVRWNEQVGQQQLYALTESNKLQILQLAAQTLQVVQSLQQETIIYDVVVLRSGNDQRCYLTSCKDMPVPIYVSQIRLYNSIDHRCLGAISDKKENSERYLSPLVLCQSQHKCFGAGSKFLSCYDLNRCTRSFRFKQFDKKHLSAIAVQPGSAQALLSVGEFTGEMHVVSPLDNQVLFSWKCHVDGVTDIHFLPSNPSLLLSSARFDDFKYLWDLRKPDRFVSCYRLKNSTNQRINIQIASDCKHFLTGSQSGELWSFPIDANEQPSVHQLFNSSLNWVESSQSKKLALCAGERHFSDTDATGGVIRILSELC